MAAPHQAREVRPVTVMFVCTANTGRSALAAAALQRRVRERGLPVVVSSAGCRASAGEWASPLVVQAAAAYAGDLSRHRSRLLTAEMVRAADLVVAMAGEHRDSAVRLAPDAADRTFVLRDLVARAAAAGARGPQEPLTEYLRRLAVAPPPSLPGQVDVADPYGQPLAVLWSTAAELDQLVGRLTELMFGQQPPG